MRLNDSGMEQSSGLIDSEDGSEAPSSLGAVYEWRAALLYGLHEVAKDGRMPAG